MFVGPTLKSFLVGENGKGNMLINHTVVVARSGQLCLGVCYCKDFYRCSSATPYSREGSHDHIMGHNWRYNNHRSNFLVHVDLPVPACYIFLATTPARVGSGR